ncbi:CHAP domain-containing protein [Nocardioides dokdonensis]|uniref:CHAP domain-containing protein n=1 Tax=Nocardioides dokdonensis TaxID=450734 RepID=UPI001470F853|nr:CHAP domain-containing protein [Nocardioides dokdonensis]
MGLLVALVAALVVLPAVPAQGYSTYLCTGYQGCQDKGYSHAGYRTAGQQMWWRMYGGHNCTNYVAYRLVQNGMPNERPWSGSGNATNWGEAMSHLVDDQPVVGAVAWWRAGTPGGGSVGHLAYIEEVVSRDEIIVSEDSWGGDFHWRRLTNTGSGWPTGFIHFNDKQIEAEEAPVIAGDAAVGETLRATTGSWKPAGTTRLQWYAGNSAIEGADGQTFTPTPAQRRTRLSVAVVATKKGYADGTATSQRTRKVKPGTLTTTSTPVVSGTAQVDKVLTATKGSYAPAPARTSLQWYADGEPVPEATTAKLRLTPALVGATVEVREKSTLEGYRDRVVAADAGQVAPGVFQVSEPFTVAGRHRLGVRLEVAPGTFSPSADDVTYTWLRDGKPVTGSAVGAGGRRFALTETDVGRRVAVRVEVARAGYETLTSELGAEGPVTTGSDLDVVAEGRRRKVLVDVAVSAPGVDVPEGPVRVRVGDREVVGELSEGTVRLRVTKLSPGMQRVRVLYEGTEVVRGSREVVRVSVPRR